MQIVTTNYSNSDADGVDANESVTKSFTATINNSTSNFNNATILFYEISILAPCMCVLASLAFLGNVYILACVPWIRRRAMNANLRWSLSLAGADAWAAALIALGLLFNSYLPHVWGFAYNHCTMVALEVFRVGGMLTSVFHLLALSLNHYASIVSPLKYKLLMTSQRSKVITAFLWVAPTLILTLCFSVVPDQGFRSDNCENTIFYFQLIFRAPIFVLFYVPMMTMLIVYGTILRILYTTRKNIETLRPKESASFMLKDADEKSDDSLSNPVLRKVSSAATLNPPGSNGNSLTRISKLQNRMKAVITTLLIVGTFGLGWLPSVVFFVVYCLNCTITQIEPYPKFYINAAVNSLIIFKLILNPLIYGFRIVEIRYALWSMYKGRCRRVNVPINEIPNRFRALSNVYSSKNANGKKQGTPKTNEERRKFEEKKFEILNNNTTSKDKL